MVAANEWRGAARALETAASRQGRRVGGEAIGHARFEQWLETGVGAAEALEKATDPLEAAVLLVGLGRRADALAAFRKLLPTENATPLSAHAVLWCVGLLGLEAPTSKSYLSWLGEAPVDIVPPWVLSLLEARASHSEDEILACVREARKASPVLASSDAKWFSSADVWATAGRELWQARHPLLAAKALAVSTDPQDLLDRAVCLRLTGADPRRALAAALATGKMADSRARRFARAWGLEDHLDAQERRFAKVQALCRRILSLPGVERMKEEAKASDLLWERRGRPFFLRRLVSAWRDAVRLARARRIAAAVSVQSRRRAILAARKLARARFAIRREIATRREAFAVLRSFNRVSKTRRCAALRLQTAARRHLEARGRAMLMRRRRRRAWRTAVGDAKRATLILQRAWKRALWRRRVSRVLARAASNRRKVALALQRRLRDQKWAVWAALRDAAKRANKAARVLQRSWRQKRLRRGQLRRDAARARLRHCFRCHAKAKRLQAVLRGALLRIRLVREDRAALRVQAAARRVSARRALVVAALDCRRTQRETRLKTRCMAAWCRAVDARRAVLLQVLDRMRTRRDARLKFLRVAAWRRRVLAARKIERAARAYLRRRFELETSFFLRKIEAAVNRRLLLDCFIEWRRRSRLLFARRAAKRIQAMARERRRRKKRLLELKILRFLAGRQAATLAACLGAWRCTTSDARRERARVAATTREPEVLAEEAIPEATGDDKIDVAVVVHERNVAVLGNVSKADDLGGPDVVVDRSESDETDAKQQILDDDEEEEEPVLDDADLDTASKNIEDAVGLDNTTDLVVDFLDAADDKKVNHLDDVEGVRLSRLVRGLRARRVLRKELTARRRREELVHRARARGRLRVRRRAFACLVRAATRAAVDRVEARPQLRVAPESTSKAPLGPLDGLSAAYFAARRGVRTHGVLAWSDALQPAEKLELVADARAVLLEHFAADDVVGLAEALVAHPAPRRLIFGDAGPPLAHREVAALLVYRDLVTALSLYGARLAASGALALATYGEALQELIIERADLGPVTAATILAGLSRNISVLSLAHNPRLGAFDVVVAPLQSFLQRAALLATLNLKHTGLTTVPSGDFRELESLSLSGNSPRIRVGDLRRAPRLVYLELGRCDDGTVDDILLRLPPSLKTLVLRDSILDQQHVDALAAFARARRVAVQLEPRPRLVLGEDVPEVLAGLEERDAELLRGHTTFLDALRTIRSAAGPPPNVDCCVRSATAPVFFGGRGGSRQKRRPVVAFEGRRRRRKTTTRREPNAAPRRLSYSASAVFDASGQIRGDSFAKRRPAYH